MQEGLVSRRSPKAFHRMGYYEWGPASANMVLWCLRGLTLIGCDFDFIAVALVGQCRVVRPDVAERGQGEWPVAYRIRENLFMRQHTG